MAGEFHRCINLPGLRITHPHKFLWEKKSSLSAKQKLYGVRFCGMMNSGR